MRGAETYQRRSRELPVRERILIVCEGRKTETTYLNRMRQHYRMSTLKVDIRGPETGTHPCDLVARAHELTQEAVDEHEPFEKAWCVFDRDQHDHIDQALVTARARGILVAFSNPCFELWYLLHYADQTSHIDRTRLKPRLTRLLGKPYHKAGDYFALLLERQPEAVRRARELRKQDDRDKGGRMENPYTSVDELVTRLNELADSQRRPIR